MLDRDLVDDLCGRLQRAALAEIRNNEFSEDRWLLVAQTIDLMIQRAILNHGQVAHSEKPNA